MGLFDTPHHGLYEPDFIYCKVDSKELSEVKYWAETLKINFERWIICDGEITHLNLNPGIIFYSENYKCIRGTFDTSQKLVKFNDFINQLKNDTIRD